MWVLMILGGGLLVFLIAPITITGFEEFDLLWSSSQSVPQVDDDTSFFTFNFESIISSLIKAIIAIILVVIWIVILSKFKNWMFRKQLKS